MLPLYVGEIERQGSLSPNADPFRLAGQNSRSFACASFVASLYSSGGTVLHEAETLGAAHNEWTKAI